MRDFSTDPPGLKNLKKTRPGMTLVELLIVIPLVVIIGGIVVTLFVNYIDMFIANQDVATAARRADSVFRLLDGPIHHAGLGVNSRNESFYKRNWMSSGSYDTDDMNVPFPARWKGLVIPSYDGVAEAMDAVILSGDAAAGVYTGIGIVYAVPSGIRIISSDNVTNDSGGFKILLVNHDLPSSLPTPTPVDKTDMRSWLTVPGTDTSVPMLVESYAPDQQTLTVTVPGRIPQNMGGNSLPMHQELFWMKAIMAYVQDDEFRMVDITNGSGYYGANTNGAIPVEGIRAIRFEMPEDRKHITVRVLAMGDSKGAKHARTHSPALLAKWGLTPEDAERQVYLEEFSVRWRVRDLSERTL